MRLFVSIIFLLTLISGIVNAQQGAKGITTVGSHAVTETVNDIMARQILGAQHVKSIEAEKELHYPDRRNLPQNPNSPNVSSYSSSSNELNRINQVRVSTTLTKGVNFTGPTFTTTGANSTPPDNMGYVGPTQFIVVVNGQIVSYNKTTGVADGALNTSLDNFFASIKSSTFTCDPRVRYDRLSKRWFFLDIDLPDTNNRVLIGVSTDSIITASTVMNFFYYQQSGYLFLDYPTLGIDANALYIGGNLFNGTTFAGTTALVVQKSSILGSGPIVSKAFSVGNSTSGIYTPQGVDNLYDPASTEGYFIGVDIANYGQLDLARVSNPGSISPAISTTVTFTVPSTYTPGITNTDGFQYCDSKPGGTGNRLDVDDERLMSAMIRNGHLWTAHHIEVTNTGVGSSSGTRIGARWYDIKNYSTGLTPILNQSGTAYSNSLTNTRDKNYIYPTITVNGQGHALIGFTAAGYYSYANAGYTYRFVTDPQGTTQVPDSNTASSTAYNFTHGLENSTDTHRWGDYSMTECDPSDDMTFWTIQEFCDVANSYGCRVTQIKAPAPATLTTATPNVLGPGSNLTLVIKGDTTTGLGFYEPGSGFSKHLSASIDGGITVNSVTYNSPGTIRLNVTTTGGTDGARTITITNPDGQVVSSGAIFTYHASTDPTLAVTPASLTGFNYSLGYGPSLSQSYNLSGTNLTGYPGNITITAPTNFEVSLDDINFAASKSVSFTSATLSSTAIHVRLKSGLSIAPYSGDVTNAGGGATTQNVTCNGVVNPVPSPIIVVSPGTLTGFSYYTGAGPSTSQSYNLSGSYLTPSSGTITVQCLTNYEVSANNSTFSTSVPISYTGGALSATAIYIRLKAGLSTGNYNSETISNAGGGATTQTVICSGVVNDISSLFTDDFNYNAGTLITANGWTAHNGAGTNTPLITSPGLTYSNYAGSGVGNAVTLSGNGEDDNHSFTSMSSGSVYASAMVNVTSASSGGDYFFHFGVTGSTSYNARVFAKNAVGGFVLGVCKSNTTANIKWSSNVLSTGTTHFIVLKYTFVAGTTNDKAELFIDPAAGGIEPASDLSSIITDADFTAIDKICLRQSSTTPVVKIDGIRIGQTWASVTPRSVQVLTLAAIFEGPFNGSVMENDIYPLTVTVELRDASTNALVESKTGNLSQLGVGTFTFTNAADGTPYYIAVKSPNTLETQSGTPQSFISGLLSYNFTTGIGQAYNDGGGVPQMIQVGSKWCIYSGDVNQDGGIDGFDISPTDNDNASGGTPSVPSGLPTDINGDGGTDAYDLSIADNNNHRGVYAQLTFTPLAVKHTIHTDRHQGKTIK